MRIKESKKLFFEELDFYPFKHAKGTVLINRRKTIFEKGEKTTKLRVKNLIYGSQDRIHRLSKAPSGYVKL